MRKHKLVRHVIVACPKYLGKSVVGRRVPLHGKGSAGNARGGCYCVGMSLELPVGSLALTAPKFRSRRALTWLIWEA